MENCEVKYLGAPNVSYIIHDGHVYYNKEELIHEFKNYHGLIQYLDKYTTEYNGVTYSSLYGTSTVSIDFNKYINVRKMHIYLIETAFKIEEHEYLKLKKEDKE